MASNAANLISGNTDGVIIQSPGATGNVVVGNFIGTDISGTTVLGNATDGVEIVDAPDNTIGGPASGEGNLISGSGDGGVRVAGSSATGTSSSATASAPICPDCVVSEQRLRRADQRAPGNTVGGTAQARLT